MSIAALRHDGRTDADALLHWAVEQARARGLRVRGLLMHHPDGRAHSDCRMVMVDVASGETTPVSQALGSCSRGCRADPQGFARAGQALRAALQEQPAPDLVVVNRFGRLEAAGGGFRHELLGLLSAGIPVLLAVAEDHLADWATFSGGWPTLAATPEALGPWLDQLSPATA